MEEVWTLGEAPVRAVMDTLNGRAGKPRAYTTYMTIMSRLHKKGLLARRREGNTDFYAPVLAAARSSGWRAGPEPAQGPAAAGPCTLQDGWRSSIGQGTAVTRTTRRSPPRGAGASGCTPMRGVR